MNSENNDYDQAEPPAWAIEFFNRLSSLEAKFASSPFLQGDPNVIARSLGADFTPSSALLEHCPFIDEDFFRRPLPDTERRHFLFECPKNTIRSYDLPEFNKISTSSPARRFDTQLHDIQYHLSGLTCPISWFAYQLVHSQWDLDTTRQ
jgi:hypothetical protein